MKNKLPILLALLLLTIAAMPLLRKLNWQRLLPGASAMTVPPPSPPDWRENSSTGPLSVAKVGNTSASPPLLAAPSGVPPQAPVAPAAIPSPPTMPPPSAGAAMPPRPVALAAETLLENAVHSVESHRTISASIRQTGELFGHQILGKGDYQEFRQGPIPLIHLELRVEIDSQTTNLKQVCNGTTFWTYRKMPQGESLTKLDAVRAMAAVQQAKDTIPGRPATMVPGLGGLGRLVRGLNSQFQFTSVEADTLGGLPVWKLTGGWRKSELPRLIPKQKESIDAGRPADLSGLPPYAPDTVTLYLGQDDCFPFRIDYCRKMAKSLGRTEASENRCLLSIEFYELNFSGPIDSSKFLFAPGALGFSDVTDEFLRSLGP